MTPDEQRTDLEGSEGRRRQPPRDDGLTVGQWRLRYILVAVVTVVWIIDVGAVILANIFWDADARPQPAVHGVFLLVVVWVLGIELRILELFRKD